MDIQCPGRKDRDLDSLLVKCPECHKVVEIFSDEQKVRCRCGHVILRETVPSCIMWCPAAERCLGDVIDLREVRKRIEKMHAKADASGYVKNIQDRIRKAKDTRVDGDRPCKPPTSAPPPEDPK